MEDKKTVATPNSATFFANKDCRFYPCHECEEDINCLFCYCPLYTTDCPGVYTMIEKDGGQVKNCSSCIYPHLARNYANVIKLLKQ